MTKIFQSLRLEPTFVIIASNGKTEAMKQNPPKLSGWKQQQLMFVLIGLKKPTVWPDLGLTDRLDF